MKHDYHDFGGAFNDGYQLRPLLPWRWLFLVLLFVAYCANAQVTTYTYLGQPMTGNGTATSLNFTQLTGTVTLAAPLNPNQANQVVVPISYVFNNTLTAPTTGSFSFTTQNGMITAWNLIMNSSAPPQEMDMSITDQGDIYFYALWTSDCEPSYPNCTHWSATNTTPGAWSIDMATMAALQARLATMQTAYTTYYNGYLSVRTSDLSWMSRAITDEDKESAVIINCRDKKGAC